MIRSEARDILAQWKAHSLAAENSSLPAAELAVRAAETFRVLSDPTRLRILQTLLLQEEMRVGDLADHVEMSQSAVSHHLRILRHSRLVRTRRAGREIYYAPDDSHVELLLRVCAEHVTSDH